MLDKKEIQDAFNMLSLANESKRQRILSQGVIKREIANKVISRIITDNITKLNQKEERDAKLE